MIFNTNCVFSDNYYFKKQSVRKERRFNDHWVKYKCLKINKFAAKLQKVILIININCCKSINLTST